MKYYNKPCMPCKYCCKYPRYYNPCWYSQIEKLPVSGNINGCGPVTCYIYYSDGFYKKRESWTIYSKEYYKFDLVDSVMTVTLQCDPIGENCD